jgi:hypothetical protein
MEKIMAKETKETEKIEKLTPGQEMWEQIKNLKMVIFGLPGQQVHMYYDPIQVDPTKLFIKQKTGAGAALPALEEAISSHFDIERTDRFLIITRK